MRSGVLKSCCLAISAVMGVSGAIIACSGASSDSGWQSSNASQPSAPGDDPIAGVTQDLLSPLANAPTFLSGVLTITVAPGELGMVSLRAIDSAIIVNGLPTLYMGMPVTSANVTAITITEAGGAGSADAGDAQSLLTTEFIVDYSNGLFATGASSGHGITLSLAGTEPTVFGVKGTGNADTITFGATGVNVNNDAYPDILWTGNGGAGTFVVSMGSGDDTWSAGGDMATGARFNNDAPANPAVNYGPGVVVYGGAGDDTFNEATVTPYETIYGGGQAGDTVDYSARGTSVAVSLSTPGIASTISGHCAIGGGDAGDAAADGGALACVSDEFDDIKNDVFIVYGGSGDDFLTASASAIIAGAGGADAGADAGHADAGDAGHDAGAVDAGHADAGDAGHDAGADAGAVAGAGSSVIFYGGAGNDTLTPFTGPYVMNGGAGNDTFLMGTDGNHGAGTIIGGAGVDRVDFTNRTTAIHVTMDGMTPSGTFASGAVTENMIVSADVENIHGGAGNDVLVGNALDNVINGGPGADIMTGGGAGSDTVDYSDAVGPVWAQIDGTNRSGAGTFTQHPGTASMAYVDGTCPFGTSTEQDTIGIDITNLVGSQGNDCLFGQPHGSACPGSTCQNNLTGGPGSDMLFGLDDDDILEGSGGVGGDGATDSNYLDCGSGFANTGHDLGVAGYRANCQF